jgi:hypothetical protein
MLHEFQNFNKERLDVHQLIALAAFGRSLRAEYEAHQLDEPAWLDVQIKSLRHEIRSRSLDQLEARRKEINARLDSLKTPTEKKQELLKEKKKLEEQLAEIGA